MEKKKKILFVMPKFDAGGAEKSLLTLLYLLADREDVKVDVMFFKKEGMFISQIPDRINVLPTEESLKAIYSSFSIKNLFKGGNVSRCTITRPIATFISRTKYKDQEEASQYRWVHFYREALSELKKTYDIACGYLDGEATYYIVDKVRASKKIGWNQNDYRGLGLSPVYDKPYYKKLDNIVTLTDECEDSLYEVFPEFKKKILQIPPIVSQSYIQAQAELFFPQEYKDNTQYRFVSVGRFVRQKGFDIAIAAAKILEDKGVNFKWYIIGDGELYDALTKQVSDAGLEKSVIFLGKRDNPYPYIKNADIFIQPSRFEGKSVILNEAKMLHAAIIATDYKTVFDQLENGISGLIVKKEDAEDLANGIINLLNNTELYNKLTSNLKNTDFDNKAVVNKYLRLFELSNTPE